MDYSEAKKSLLNLEFDKCIDFFAKNKYILEEAYCWLLLGDLDKANYLFLQKKQEDLRADWGFILIQFIRNYIQHFPTYLQVRSFLEIDIGLLIRANQPAFVENIINAAPIFYEINQESYKFIARVMMNYNFPSIAKIYLDKGCENCYNDPELHFLYGQYHLKNNKKKLAKSEFEKSLKVLPKYFPAEKMLRSL